MMWGPVDLSPTADLALFIYGRAGSSRAARGALSSCGEWDLLSATEQRLLRLGLLRLQESRALRCVGFSSLWPMGSRARAQ